MSHAIRERIRKRLSQEMDRIAAEVLSSTAPPQSTTSLTMADLMRAAREARTGRRERRVPLYPIYKIDTSGS